MSKPVAKDKNVKTLLGIVDSRSKKAIMSRGRNVYRAGSYAAHKGGGSQFGRPTSKQPVVKFKDAINRRLFK